MKTNLYPQEWLLLSQRERSKLVEVFSIRRSGGTVMQDNTMISDGHTMDDLKAVTVEKMQKFTGSEETDFLVLMDLVLAKFKEEEAKAVEQAIIDTRELSINRIQRSINELQLEAIRLGVFSEVEWVKPEEKKLRVEEPKEEVLKTKKSK